MEGRRADECFRVRKRERREDGGGFKDIIKSYCMPGKTLQSAAFASWQSHFCERVLFLKKLNRGSLSTPHPLFPGLSSVRNIVNRAESGVGLFGIV